MSANGTDTQGWTSSPDGRGTYDILLSCVLTIFLCCWTSVYPSIGADSDGKWARFRDKLGLAFLGILGPDFLVTLALGQKSSARRSVKVGRGDVSNPRVSCFSLNSGLVQEIHRR